MAFSEFEDLSGRVLGNRYRIQKEIGRGGFGIVYRAEQGLFSADRRKTLRLRDVALKLFKNQFVHPENAQEVFREAVMLERLASQARARGETPHLVTVYDIGVFETDDDAIPFVAMELAEGGSLSSQIRNLPLPLARAAALLRQVCAGVRLAHDNDIFHRDLKPGNVLFTSGGFSSGGFLMVSDFGVAIDLCDALRSGGCAGDIRYAPPDPSRNRIASGARRVPSRREPTRDGFAPGKRTETGSRQAAFRCPAAFVGTDGPPAGQKPRPRAPGESDRTSRRWVI